MTSATLSSPVLEFDEPAGIAPRGTLIVLTGRGEPPSIYRRLGRRLASDAYRVRVVETRLDDLDATRRAVAAQLADAVAPRVLVGSDAGAAFAAQLAGELEVDAVILAGIALPGATADAASWDGELEARTACPAHRGVLADAAARGRLAEELPDALADVRSPSVPTLVIHGDADPVTPPRAAAERFARLTLVSDGRHDILNDVTHRSVAATIVLFLERLRLGPELPRIIREA